MRRSSPIAAWSRCLAQDWALSTHYWNAKCLHSTWTPCVTVCVVARHVWWVQRSATWVHVSIHLGFVDHVIGKPTRISWTSERRFESEGAQTSGKYFTDTGLLWIADVWSHSGKRYSMGWGGWLNVKDHLSHLIVLDLWMAQSWSRFSKATSTDVVHAFPTSSSLA